MSEGNKNNYLNELSETKLYYLDRLQMHCKSIVRAVDNGIDLAMELENDKPTKKNKGDSDVREILSEALDNYYISIVEDIEMLYGVAKKMEMVEENNA